MRKCARWIDVISLAKLLDVAVQQAEPEAVEFFKDQEDVDIETDDDKTKRILRNKSRRPKKESFTEEPTKEFEK